MQRGRWQPPGYKALRFGVLCFLMHNLQDHLTRRRAALRGGVHADGLLRSTCVLLPVHIYPEDHKVKDGYGSPVKPGVFCTLLATSPRPEVQKQLLE